MLRKQKSKILVFLLMLGILYGCKRHLLDPLNPQTQLPPKVKLDKVKGFYENGRYKNQPKRTSSNGNERMTAADSARFKDFEPEWDKTEVELLPNNEKMLIVPVVRFLPVDYNENIGFIRRLCIRVDANEDFIEANIVELTGNITFVKENHNAIFKNYKENNILGFSGVMATYGLDYDKISTKEFENGVGNSCANCLIVAVVGSCTIVADNSGVVIWEFCDDNSGGDGGGVTGNGNGGGGTGDAPGCTCIRCVRPPSGIPNPTGPFTIPNVPIITLIPPSNAPNIPAPTTQVPNIPYFPNGPGSAPNYDPIDPNNGSGGSGTYNPPPRPPKGYEIPTVITPTVPNVPRPPNTSNTPMPFPGMVLDEEGVWVYPTDNGVSWDHGWGDGIPRDANGNPIVPMVLEDENIPIPNTSIDDPDGILMDYIHDIIDGTNAIKTVLLSPKNPRKLTATQLNVLRTVVLPEREKALAEAKEMMITTKAQYQIKYVANNANGGRTYYNPATQKIVMEVINPNGVGAPNNGWSNAMHEMKHGFQFIDGKTSFNKTSGDAGSLCDIYDEVEAYKRECIFIQSYDFGTQDINSNPSLGFVIDPASVILYGNTLTPSLNYQLLPANQRNITTPEGQLLIFLGITAWEVFVQP